MKHRALILLAVFLPALTGGSSGVTPEPLRLQPFVEVDLARFVPADFGPFVTLAGVTVEDVPWVLVTAPASYPSKQIIVPMSGKLPNRITVEADVIDRGFLAQDQAGTLYVRQQGRKSGPRHALAAYARSGALLNVRPLDPALQYAVTSAGIVAVFRDALNLMRTDGGIPRSFSLKPALSDAQPIALELPGKRLAVLDAVSGAGQVVDLVSGKQSSFLYEDEDILKSKATYTGSGRAKGIVIRSAAADRNGFVWLTLSGIRLSEGAVVLKTDGTGRIVQRIRCALPNSAKFAVGGNPEGFMAPGTILVGEDTLWLLDAKGFAAGYRLPAPN